MKKIVSLILVFALTCSLCACGKKKEADLVKDDLIKYNQTDLAAIKGDEATALNRYSDVVAQLDTLSKSDLLAALNNEIIPTYTNFVNALRALTPATDEVKALQATYVEGAQLQLDGITALSAAIEANDSDAAAAANATVEQGRAKIEQHRNDMITLAGQHGIKFKTETEATTEDIANVTTDDTSDMVTEAVPAQ